ncbi:hypothetical protein CHGG_04526 [Chaetomium globosum CBS 148.51]|uniref:PCI domain-containing protein n=1 Tax=Chaetomium globosum (strain ATCC 6205 / CBS 148.51 / DSM 1962 / NBRC 6347 / NRRL 1970) TaxID=306901 RepID=Q2H120_CHAGB|nr:uncharacterized protein CHGG_04526 [Chaetomium globosum CBS 148.51]EAQ87907.1 hypothetical protein CHGG_04526 [Chaetomium globosum CBS 148.51]
MAHVVKFLSGIRTFVLEQNGDELRSWLVVEPDVASIYFEMSNELKSSFPANSSALENLIDKSLPQEDNVPEGKGSPWPSFNSFIKEYLEYWRDVDFADIVRLHSRLSDLLNSCANALANPTYGSMLLQTSMSLSESLSKLVMSLTRQKDLLAQIQGGMAEGESGERKSVVELAADIIQKIFTSCLTDRSSTRWFHFDHDHYMRAEKCLAEAYRECLPQFQKHRRQILTYWIPTNLLLGRFPSQALLQRPEAAGFADIFLPICAAIRSGNFVAFYKALDLNLDWLWDKVFYLKFLYRLKPLVWRSFTRRVFLITWQGTAGEGGNRAASLSFEDLATAAGYVQKLLEGYVPAQPAARPRPSGVNNLLVKAVTNSAASEADADSLLMPPPGGPRRLMPSEGLIFGNQRPTPEKLESVIAGLVYSNLLNGFIARQQKRFAVEGAKKKGGNAVAAGWPVPYESILERAQEAHQEALDACDAGESTDPPGEIDDVPGWVRIPS